MLAPTARTVPAAPTASGLLVADKPAGMTSHDVVAQVRRVLRTRRVGHAGTLDPMATGVLVLGVEKATRLLGYLTLTEKEYRAVIRLGQSTTTDDAEGEVTFSAPRPVSSLSLSAAVAALTGSILQVPPAVSAIKVNGQRAYKLTRSGAAPSLASRPVTVYSFEVASVALAGDFVDVEARIRCSSGTYIRSLARDLGAALGTGGHLTALRRTQVGPYTLADACPLDSPTLIPLETAAAAAFPRRDLSTAEAASLAHGAPIPLPPAGPLPPGPVAAFAPDGSLVALLEDRNGKFRPLAVFC